MAYKGLATCFVIVCAVLAGPALGQDVRVTTDEQDKTITVTEKAAGTNLSAKDAAKAAALRKAVENACGTFITAKSKAQDYKLVYDKIFTNAVGYVKEIKSEKYSIDAEYTTATLTVLVSTQKFEKDWSSIAATLDQEGNPRVIIVINEGTLFATTTTPTGSSDVVQGKLEDFFINKGLKLMDRETATKVSDRDKELAAVKDDAAELAALGARFKADVILVGKATAKYSKTIKISGQDFNQFVATLSIRAIQTDSARVLASKAYGPVTVNTLQLGGGADKALAKLAEDNQEDLLKAIVEAWRKRANVSRTIELNISGMDYNSFKTFKSEVAELRGVQAINLKEITESIANVDFEYAYDNQQLADVLTELKKVKLEVTEITPNRIKMKVVK